jgi:hypothetical protein
VLRSLEKDGAPILVERARKPSAVLISLKDYGERFVDRAADEQRRAIVEPSRAFAFAPSAARRLSTSCAISWRRRMTVLDAPPYLTARRARRSVHHRCA